MAPAFIDDQGGGAKQVKHPPVNLLYLLDRAEEGNIIRQERTHTQTGKVLYKEATWTRAGPKKSKPKKKKEK